MLYCAFHATDCKKSKILFDLCSLNDVKHLLKADLKLFLHFLGVFGQKRGALGILFQYKMKLVTGHHEHLTFTLSDSRKHTRLVIDDLSLPEIGALNHCFNFNVLFPVEKVDPAFRDKVHFVRVLSLVVNDLIFREFFELEHGYNVGYEGLLGVHKEAYLCRGLVKHVQRNSIP
jgi:hypothetical protein